jgi:hypothetical protein
VATAGADGVADGADGAAEAATAGVATLLVATLLVAPSLSARRQPGPRPGTMKHPVVARSAIVQQNKRIFFIMFSLCSKDYTSLSFA